MMETSDKDTERLVRIESRLVRLARALAVDVSGDTTQSAIAILTLVRRQDGAYAINALHTDVTFTQVLEVAKLWRVPFPIELLLHGRALGFVNDPGGGGVAHSRRVTA